MPIRRPASHAGVSLFKLDACTGFGQFCGDFVSFRLRNAFFQGLRSRIDDVLGFF